MTNAVIEALRQYEREQRSKKAVLLTPDGGYYLYENRFCSISDFELTVTGPDLQVQGNSVPCALFFGVTEDTLCWSAKETGSSWPDRLSLIFHIALADEDGLLRGILFAQGQKAYLTLFTDADTEKLYRAVSASAQSPTLRVSPEQELTAYAANCARNDLHRLTALYLNGQRLSQLRGEVHKGDDRAAF